MISSSGFGDTGDSQYLPDYTTADASVDFDLGHWSGALKNAKLKINVNNVADRNSLFQ